MRYENIKTGAVIDSPFPINGDLWVVVDNPNQKVTDLEEEELRAFVLELQSEIKELETIIDDKNGELELLKSAEPKGEPTADEENEFVEEEVNLEELTNDQLETLAKDQNIKLTTADKKNKDTLIAAIVAGLE